METRQYVITLDYLAGSVFGDPEKFGKELAAYLGGGIRIARPRNGFTHGFAVEVQDEIRAEFHVSPASKNPLWVFATGQKSQALSNFLTEGVWDWYVTRQDAALDIYDPQAFPLLVQAARSHAEAAGLTTAVAGNWDRPDRGRTFYLGSRSSRYFHRIYEKGRKERVDPSWIRCELEHKPDRYPDRVAATKLSAAQLWAMHAGPIFGKALDLDLAEVFLQPAARAKRVARDCDRARRALAAQYGKTIGQWLREAGGDPSAFVSELLAAIEHQERVRLWDRAAHVEMPSLENPQ